MKKNLLIIMALLMTINTLAQEPALYHVTYDCEAKGAAGAAKLYRWSLDIGKTTAVFYNDNERGFNEDLAKLHVNGDPIRALEQMDALSNVQKITSAEKLRSRAFDEIVPFRKFIIKDDTSALL